MRRCKNTCTNKHTQHNTHNTPTRNNKTITYTKIIVIDILKVSRCGCLKEAGHREEENPLHGAHRSG